MQEWVDLDTVASFMLRLLAKIKLMSRIRLLFAWLVLAAIPLQGFAAASMLYCGMGPRHEAVAQVQVAPAGHHDHASHSHGQVVKVEKTADGKSQLPDASHKCGVCASCCHSAAIIESVRVLAIAPLPQAEAAALLVPIHPRPSQVPDKPPRA